MVRRFAVLSSLAFLLSQCGSTTDEGGVTSIRVIPNFDNAWSLTQLVLEANERRATVPDAPAPLTSGESVLILLRDEAAGQPMDLAVWGLANGKRVARGNAAFTPTLHRALDVPVDLTLINAPCDTWCSPGAKACAGDAVRECLPGEQNDNQDGTACPSWSAEKACPATAPYCSSGECSARCVDECAAGSTRCAGGDALQRCGQADSDPCLDWLAEETCEGGTHCESGVCTSAPCSDECSTAGATSCANGGKTTCGQFDADACLEWGPAAACPTGQSCSNGECSATCADECQASSCSGNTWKQCGQYDLDPCLDASAGISCAPTDACHVGSCSASGGCASVAIKCNTPPAAQCVSGATLRTYAPSGSCGGSGCTYPFTDTSCSAPANAAASCAAATCQFTCKAGYQRAGNVCVPITGWTTLPSGTTQSLFGVWGVGSNVWAVGYGTANVVLRRNGAAWAQTTVASWPYGIWGTSANNIYVVGAQIFYSSTGAAWSTQTAPNNGRYRVWGSSANNVYAVGSAGTIVRTTGNGTWTSESSGTGNVLSDVWGSAANDIYVVGRQGTILHSTGNGVWAPQSSGTSEDLNAIWGSGPNDLYIAGWGGRIMHSTGNGVWTSQNPTNRSLYGVWGSSSSDIYMVGSQGVVFHSSGGDVWTEQESGTTQTLHAVWGSGPNDIYAVGDNGTILHRP